MAAASASATRVVSLACVVHEGDDDLISVAPSKRNTATAPLDSTSTPMMPSHLVSGIEPVTMPTRCSIERPGDDTTVEAPAIATSACSLTIERLGDTAPAAATVFKHVDVEEVIVPQLSDVSLKHFPASWSLFVCERGTPTTADSIQVTSLFLLSEDVFPTIIRPIAVSIVQFVLCDVRPLPWPSFLDYYHVGDEILLMPCSLFTCIPGGGCQKHPWPPPQMISLIGHYCSVLISMEGPSCCLQCVHMQLCRSPDGAKLSGILFLFTEGAQVDGNSLKYFIHCSSETMQWEIAWTLSELSSRCEPWTSWQLHFLVPGSRTTALLINLMAQDEIKTRPELSLQTVMFTSNCYNIVLHCMGTCSSLQSTECPWFLASGIQLGTQLFLGADNFWFQLSTEGYIEIHHGLLLHMWNLAVIIYFTAIFSFWLQNYILPYGSELLQWLIAWSEIGNAYAVVMVSYLYSQVWVIFSTPYGTEQFEWQIAWLLNLRTMQLTSWSSCAMLEGMPQFTIAIIFPCLAEQFWTAGFGKRLAQGRAKISGRRNVSGQAYYPLRFINNPSECSVDIYIHRRLFYKTTRLRYTIVVGIDTLQIP